MVCLCLYALLLTVALIAFRLLLEKFRIRGYPGRPVFVSGCNSGFGRLLVLKLLTNGIPVFAGCLTEKGEESLKKDSRGLKGKLETVPLDVTRQESVDKAFAFVKSKVTGLWGLVNNAGIMGVIAPDDWTTPEDYMNALDVNAIGVIRVTQTFKPLIKKRHGRIVTVASILGRVATPSMGPYCVSKFAVEGYMDTLRLEMEPFRVTVHILEPGMFATDMLNLKTHENYIQNQWDKLTQEVKDEYGINFMEKAKESAIKGLSYANKDVSLVVDAYYHALTAWFPRRRYAVGPDSQFFLTPFSLWPTCLQDLFWRMIRKLQHLPLPKACEHL